MDVIDDGNRHKLVENDIEVHCYHEDRKIHLNIHNIYVYIYMYMYVYIYIYIFVQLGW